MSVSLDGTGIAAIIGGGAAAVVSVGTFVMQLISWRDQRHLKIQQQQALDTSAQRMAVINQVKAMVNGRLGELKIRIAKEAFEMGRQFQAASPGQPSPEFPKAQADEYVKMDEPTGVSTDGAGGGAGAGSAPATPAALDQAPVAPANR